MIVCAASNNAGKLKELRRILERMGHEVKSLRELGINLDPEETGTTFAENARIRPRRSARPAACPPWPMTRASAPTRCTVRPASTAPATPGITATTTRTTQSCCGSWPTCRRNSAAQSSCRRSASCCRTDAHWRSRANARAALRLHCRTATTASAMTRCSSPTSTAHPTASTPNTERRSYAQLTPDEKDAISHRGRAMEKLEAQLPAFLG